MKGMSERHEFKMRGHEPDVWLQTNPNSYQPLAGLCGMVFHYGGRLDPETATVKRCVSWMMHGPLERFLYGELLWLFPGEHEGATTRHAITPMNYAQLRSRYSDQFLRDFSCHPKTEKIICV